MKLMRLAMCVAAFVIIGKVALAEDIDVRALQEKLAQQEARLSDLQAKVNYNGGANANYAGAPESVLSIRKNATITIGGTLNTRYFYRDAKIESYASYGSLKDGMGWSDNPDAFNVGNSNNTAGLWGTKAKASQGNLGIADAEVNIAIDVNDYFDAFIKIELQASNNSASDNAEQYWVRWKNICNSGFGVLVGRAPLVFGKGGHTVMGTWVAGNGDGMGEIVGDAFAQFVGVGHNDQLAAGIIPPHNTWDDSGVMQVTPYWEGLDGKFKWELSFMQKMNNRGGAEGIQQGTNAGNFYYLGSGDAYPHYDSNNYGFGTISSRINYTPIEGLDLSASVVNYYDKAPFSWDGQFDPWGSPDSGRYSKNNTAIDLAFDYRPCFLPKLMIWSQWIHGWNVNNLKDVTSDAINYGASYDFTEAFTLFAQGDFLRTADGYKYLDEGGLIDSASRDARGWAVNFGAQYRLPYGVTLEAGYKHEQITFYNNRSNLWGEGKRNDSKSMKVKGDTVYAHVGFDF